jgi:hypothetical protein
VRRGGSLATRLDRIERSRQQTRRAPVQPLVKQYDRDHEIIAIKGWTGAICEREASESIGAFISRSRAVLAGQGWLAAIYAPEPPPEAMRGPSAPIEGMPGTADPLALSGIGRKATEAELKKMAVGSANQKSTVNYIRLP